jgi:poly-beta-1,6-N-acetyl-D-glucosamine synthase
VADNCSDHTAEIAAAAGAEVFVTVGNKGKKAGALNQALEHAMPYLSGADCIFSTDADVDVDAHFLENVERHFERDPDLAAVSSNHRVEFEGSLLERLQAIEFARDRRYMGRKQGNAGCCMSGQGTVPTTPGTTPTCRC